MKIQKIRQKNKSLQNILFHILHALILLLSKCTPNWECFFAPKHKNKDKKVWCTGQGYYSRFVSVYSSTILHLHTDVEEPRHKEKQQWAESSGRLLRTSSGWVQTNKEESGLPFCEDSLSAKDAADIGLVSPSVSLYNSNQA